MINKIGKPYAYTGSVPTVKRQSEEIARSRSKSTDEVEVSTFGQVLSKAIVDGGDTKKIYENRHDAVQAIKAQIDAGTYCPCTRLLAARLVAAGITRKSI